MTTATIPNAPSVLAPVRKPMAATRVAFRSLILRDLVVLRKTLKEFIPRTILQPLLLVFVFTYVFPKIARASVAPKRRPGSPRSSWPASSASPS